MFGVFKRFAKFLETRGFTASERAFWDENGYLAIRKFFKPSEIVQLNEEIEGFWQNSRNSPSELVIDLIGYNGARTKLHDAPIEAKRHPYKLNDAFLVSEGIRDAALHPRLVGKLENILSGTPLVCNSLNFEFGSQQPFHTDSLYMTPPKDLNLVATWIALEDCEAGAGPLKYYPGSHVIPPYVFSSGRITAIEAEMDQYNAYMSAEVQRRGLKEERFLARTGDLFIWHSQLFHGGSVIEKPGKTRRSLVTHYFRSEDISCDKLEHHSGGVWMNRNHQPVH